jgi:hypothetical protein
MAISVRHRVATAVLAVLAVGGLSACDSGGGTVRVGDDGATPTTLVVSTAYLPAEGTDTQARAADLQASIDDLRASTSSGWVGRQDDVTGYLGDLSGGRWFAEPGADAATVVRGFMDTYGTDLFGVDSTSLVLEDATEPTAAGSTSVRAVQQVGDVPVLDGALVFTIGDATDEPRLNAVRGRVFGGLEAGTEPTLSATRATGRAERVSGGDAMGPAELLVLPVGTGTLAWQVTITQADAASAVAPTDGYYFIDAATGDLVTVRAASAEGRTPVLRSRSSTTARKTVVVARPTRRLAALQGSVEVTGKSPTGESLTAYGVRTDEGVVLLDSTTPTFDADSLEGGIETWDAQDTDDDSALPGQRYVEPAQNGTTITDPEAIAAQAYSRAVYDYYAQLGRASWDGQGGSLISSVHFGDNTFCNSYFNGFQMIYGNQCAPGGDPAEVSELDIDTAGHEITHGVTNSTANLIYSGQSGALNESFSDYFGNVIGDWFLGTDSNAIMEHVCEGIPDETVMCLPNPDDTASLRYMLNGNTFDDYLYVLDPPSRLVVHDITTDNGGVHLNSSIWNNALWSIRSRLAQMDGTTAIDSKLATDFDKIVYAALTTQLGPTSGFVDARRAVEQTAVEAGADAVILRVARETFDANHVCADCSDTGPAPGQVVSNASSTERLPTVHGDEIAWLTQQAGGGLGSLSTSTVGDAPAGLGSSLDNVQVVFAGDALVGLDFPGGQYPGRVVRYEAGGELTDLAKAGRSTDAAGLAGSDAGAAWVSEEEGTISYVDADGEVTTGTLPDLGGDTVTAIATGDGVVGFGTGSGQVLRWTPGQGFEQLGQVPGAVLSVAAYGPRVLVVDDSHNAALFGGSGDPVQLSTNAVPFGAAMSADYGVWSNAVGDLGGGVAKSEGVQLPDTDLYLVSFETGTIYDLMKSRGQQGFPALSGDRLVWQDAVFGGDDILTATIPAGL